MGTTGDDNWIAILSPFGNEQVEGTSTKDDPEPTVMSFATNNTQGKESLIIEVTCFEV